MLRRSFLSGLPTVIAGATLLARAGQAHAAKPITQRDFCLVLDPGHGGENEGCAGHDGRVVEKELTLTLAEGLADAVLARIPHATVLLTRTRDETLHLADRVAFANASRADLFLSLHCNASRNHDQVGFETYLLDAQASHEEAALTAQRENDAAFARPAGEGDEVATMLRELGLTQNRRHAAHFAAAIQREQAARFPDRRDRGVMQAKFDVLMGARMPAVLHEVGFLDHADDGALLRSGSGQVTIIEGLAEAVLTYFNEIVRRG